MVTEREEALTSWGEAGTARRSAHRSERHIAGADHPGPPDAVSRPINEARNFGKCEIY